MDRSELISSLKALGLEAGATTEDIHSAFRRLARELHPDVTGSKSEFRFKEITSAYNALKNVTPEELAALVASVSQSKRDIYDYYSAEKKRKADEKKIDSILDRYEEELKSFYVDRSGSEDMDMDSLVLRLKSKNPKVINSALKRAGKLVNRVEFRRAFAEVLNRKEIDENIADIINSLPFEPMAKRLIALDAAKNAENFPTGLLIALIGADEDVNVMESLLLYVKPDDVAVIMRRWPSGKIMSPNTIRRLLDSNDARVLVPLLGAMKTHFPSVAHQHQKRLRELESHSTAAVRAWAKKLAG